MDDTELRQKLLAIIARTEIADVIGRYCFAMDTRNWDLFRTCFTDDLEVEPPDDWARGTMTATIRTDDWLEAVKAFMSEMPHSQHYKTPVSYDIRGEDAVVTSLMQGKHYMPNSKGEPVSTVVGYYRDRWRHTSKGWQQASLKEIIFWNEGNWHVFDVAISHYLRAMEALNSKAAIAQA